MTTETTISLQEHARLLRRVTYASVGMAVLLIVIKTVAFFMTNSVSLLTSLVDSSLDMIASLINLVAVRKSLVPADADHRFGHGKAEPLAGLGQSAFITGSSVFICFEAVHRLIRPTPVEQGMTGILVMAVSLVATVALVSYQRYVIRRTRSLAVSADSVHYLSDIGMNAGVILALVLAGPFGLVWADPVFAILIAIIIIHSVWQIAMQSLAQLMDRELPDQERARILEIATTYPGVRDVHDLRTRASGRDKFIQAHLGMDGALSLVEAHAIADAVEQKLRREFPEADVIIHQDPLDPDGKPARGSWRDRQSRI